MLRKKYGDPDNFKGVMFNGDAEVIEDMKIKKQVIKNDKALLFDRLPKLPVMKKDDLEVLVRETYDNLMERLSRISELNQKYLQYKKDPSSRKLLQDLSAEISDLQNKLRKDWDHWHEIFNTVMRIKPIAL